MSINHIHVLGMQHTAGEVGVGSTCPLEQTRSLAPSSRLRPLWRPLTSSLELRHTNCDNVGHTLCARPGLFSHPANSLFLNFLPIDDELWCGCPAIVQ